MADASRRLTINASHPFRPAHDIDERGGRAAEESSHGHLRSRVTKRSLVVGGHKTSVSLEDAFWNELRSIAHNRELHLSELVGAIDAERQHGNLSSALRLFVLEHLRGAGR